MENIKDWCISRQLWWGHQIPAWYCEDCGEIVVDYDDPTECPHCHSKNVDYLTRVIGYMKRVSNFSEARQKEAAQRYYAEPAKAPVCC